MEETGLENMTENTEKEKVLSKEAIVAALNERHSPEKQKLLSAGRVAIAGLGGLGSNVAYALARIGVGHLHLIDFDVVDITNLNRQQYFMEHIGMYKTDALKSLLLKINPYLDIDTDCVKEYWNIFRKRNWYRQPVWQDTEAVIQFAHRS